MRRKQAAAKAARIPESRPRSAIEETFERLVHLEGLPAPEREYRFHPSRRWRFDFAWPSARLAVEIEGGSWLYGRHNRPTGFAADCEKYNQAIMAGWRVLRFTPAMVNDGSGVRLLSELLLNRNDED